MSEILTRIHRDHENMSRLLDLMDQQCADLAAGRDHEFGLMADIVDYFTRYPAQVHHPLEDRVFAWVGQQQPGLASFVEELRGDHEAQAKLGEEIAVFVKGIVAGHIVPRDEIVDRLRRYGASQRDHMNKEEARLLKAAAVLLAERDLDEIPLAAGEIEDPLFGEKQDARYAALVDALRLNS